MNNAPEIAKLIASNFIERRDAKAIQTNTGGYQPHRVGPQPRYEERPLAPFDLASLVAHVEGKQTFGHYLVSPEGNTCRMFVFDIDFNQNSIYFPDGPDNPSLTIDPRDIWKGPTNQAKKDLALQLFAMGRGLAKQTQKLLGIKVIVSYSGNKGMHVIGCLPPRTPSTEARKMAVMVLESLKCFEPLKGNNFWKHTLGFPSLDLEVFPKQDEVRPDGFGNLVRLPLGINRKSSKASFFLRMNVPFGEFKIDDPLEVLQNGSLRV